MLDYIEKLQRGEQIMQPSAAAPAASAYASTSGEPCRLSGGLRLMLLCHDTSLVFIPVSIPQGAGRTAAMQLGCASVAL